MVENEVRVANIMSRNELKEIIYYQEQVKETRSRDMETKLHKWTLASNKYTL